LLLFYLLNHRYTDTHCGNKVLWCRDHEAISHNRGYFGELDPFGVAREYCETNIPRFQQGRLLMYMVAFAFMNQNVL
jgi:hypothetical protein